MPILLLRGAMSDVVPRASARRMVAALPDAQCREVPGVGHAPTLYEPESHAALQDFFAGLERRAPHRQPAYATSQEAR